MDPADRIAAYLADELDVAQRRAFEDDLERDPVLRDQIDAVHRADAALAAQPPTALPDGAAQRLRAALRDELAATIDAADGSDAAPETGPEIGPGDAATGPAATTFTAAAPRDDLTDRRARRQIPWGAVGGMAAAVVAVAAVAVGPLGLLGGEDEGDLFATPLDEAADAPAGDAAEMESAADDPFAGPVLRGTDRPLTEADADALLADPAARTLAAAGLDEVTAADLAASHAAAFGVEPPGTDTFDAAEADRATAGPTDDADDADDADDEDDDAPQRLEEPRALLRTDGPVDPAVRDQIAACLAVVLAGGGTPVVVAAETVSFGQEPAVAFTLVGRDGSAPLARPEVWVVARQDCSVRYFTQG